MTAPPPHAPPTPIPDEVPGPRRRRRSFLIAVVLAVAVVVVGVVVAVRGWLATGGPDGAVRGYFAALADGDAATALGYGSIPDGPRTLLTDRVLHEQVRTAPITDVGVGVVDEQGNRAHVRVTYTLDFPGSPQTIQSTLGLHRSGSDWRLDYAAVATQLLLQQATQRATILGNAIPTGTALVFPAAAPIGFDTDLLQLAPARGYVRPDPDVSTAVDVEPSAAAHDAILAKVRRSIAGCLGAGADPRCPLPGDRAIPGTVRGSLTGNLSKELDIAVADGPTGDLTASGGVDIRGGYQALEFDNRRTTKSKTDFALSFDFRAHPSSPLVLQWVQP